MKCAVLISLRCSTKSKKRMGLLWPIGPSPIFAKLLIGMPLEMTSSACQSCVGWRGLGRKDAQERASSMDEEIRIIWPALGEAGTFGAIVKALLLTAQRRDEVAHMTQQGD